MKKNYFRSIIMVIIMAGMIGGTTFAWFTAKAEVADNTFTAGTVHITSDRAAGVGKIITPNWNPGDTNDVDLKIINEGTKSIYVRAMVEKMWLPSYLRVLVVYTGTTVQLLTVEWDSFCKGFTEADGAIVTGTFRAKYPSNVAYIDGTFKNLSNEDWIMNNTVYRTWCLDSAETITKNVDYSVQVFDPMYNPDWYDDVNSKTIWEGIPWGKIVYIINADFLNRGYSSTDMQNAIWHYTNALAVSGKALEIVNETEAKWSLPADNVEFDMGAGWTQGTDGYWYYMNPIPGTYTAAGLNPRTIWFNNKVRLIGSMTDNKYQGKAFTMNVRFEAVQSSNNAARDIWPESPY